MSGRWLLPSLRACIVLIGVGGLPFLHGPSSGDQTALDVMAQLADQDGLCVVTNLDAELLGSVDVPGVAGQLDDRLRQLEDAGLSLFRSGDHNVVVVADLRLHEHRDAPTGYLSHASRLVAMLPAEVVEEQRRPVAGPGAVPAPTAGTPPEEVLRAVTRREERHFRIGALSEEAQKLARDLCGVSGRPEVELRGRLDLRARCVIRDDRSVPARIARASRTTLHFLEPPVAVADDQRAVSPSELPWILWPFAQTETDTGPQVDLLAGDATLGTVLEAARRAAPWPVVIHPSAGLISDRHVWTAGHPSSIHALLWGLELTTGLRCREAADFPQGIEVYSSLRAPVVHPQALSALLTSGYVSLRHAPAVEALLAHSDYGRVIPVHAYWALADLPPLYRWVFAPDGDGDVDGVSMLWLRHVALRIWERTPEHTDRPLLHADLPLS